MPRGVPQKEIPELFFVASAIKACYGTLPDWEDSGDSDGNDCCYETEGEDRVASHRRKRVRTRHAGSEELEGGGPIDVEYKRLYCELRDRALSDIKDLVREHVERQSTGSASYEFMNVYGMCSFEEPGEQCGYQGRDEVPRCKFTKLACPETNLRTNAQRLVTVCGILSPLVSARVQPGELKLTRCGELDYLRAEEASVSLATRSKMRPSKKTHGDGVGSTMGSMESRFSFSVREDLHTLGCAYRQLVITVELLHLNLLHYLHA